MDEITALARKAQKGNQAAFDRLVKELYGQVYGQILKMTRNEDESKEIAQQTWIKVWNNLKSFRFDCSISSWIYRIAARTTIDAIRKRDRRKEQTWDSAALELKADEERSTFASAEQIRKVELSEVRICFQQALLELPSAQRDALVLREEEGLSYEEISKRLSIKIGTVMSRIYNARQTIQTKLKDFLP